MLNFCFIAKNLLEFYNESKNLGMYYLKFFMDILQIYSYHAGMSELKKLLDRIDLNILNIEFYSGGKSWNYKNVNSPYSRVYFIIDGYAQLTMYGKKYDLKSGFLYLIPCFTTVNMHCPDRFQQYYLHFTSRLQTGIDILTILKCNYQVNAEKHGIDKNIFNRIIELNPGKELFEYDANKPILKRTTERAAELDDLKSASDILECNALLRLLLSVFFQDCDKSAITHTVNGLTRFQNTTEYISQNIKSPISLQHLADIAGLTPTYFSNLFTKLMGDSPIQYINKRRIENAQLLLLSSNEPLDNIARQVGINDVFYFSRIFKKITGISPSAYRKQPFVLSRSQL
jgi:AraC-like DNA-binding protein